MSNNTNNTNTTTNNPENNQERENITKRISSIQQQLMQIDSSDEAQKTQKYLQYYSALHTDPDKSAKIDGKTAEEYLELFHTESESLSKKKKSLEDEMTELMRASRGLSKEDLARVKKQMKEQSEKAAHEPVKDLTAFAHPELDKIRSELQKNPLPGGDTASIDDGTGGQAPEPTVISKGKSNKTA